MVIHSNFDEYVPILFACYLAVVKHIFLLLVSCCSADQQLLEVGQKDAGTRPGEKNQGIKDTKHKLW